MFVNLPDEIIHKIVNKLDSIEIYYLTLTSKQLNKMKFQSILTALLFKTYYDLDRNELIEMCEYGYTLGNYLSDLSEIMSDISLNDTSNNKQSAILLNGGGLKKTKNSHKAKNVVGGKNVKW